MVVGSIITTASTRCHSLSIQLFAREVSTSGNVRLLQGPVSAVGRCVVLVLCVVWFLFLLLDNDCLGDGLVVLWFAFSYFGTATVCCSCQKASMQRAAYSPKTEAHSRPSSSNTACVGQRLPLSVAAVARTC